MAFRFCAVLLMAVTFASCNYTSNVRDSSLAVKTTPDLPDTLCPTWFTPALINDSVWCECNTDRVQQGLVLRCPSKNKICVQNCKPQEYYNTDTLNVSIFSGFCMTHNFETRQTLLASCPYNTHWANSFDFFVTLPSNILELNNFMWPLNAFVFFCQMLSCIVVFQQQSLVKNALGVYPSNEWHSVLEGARIVFLESIGLFYTFWNSQLLLSVSFAASRSISVI